MNKRTFSVWLAASGAIAAVLIVIVLGVTSALVTVADEFLTDLREGDFPAAYDHLSREFCGNASVADLRDFAQESALADYAEAVWWHRSIEGDQGALDGRVETMGGELVPVTMYFRRENGAWRICQIDWESGRATADDPTAVNGI